RASWIVFSSPMDRTRMVRSAKNFLVVGFLLPYVVLVGIVLAYFSVNRVHLVVHLLVVALLSHLALQVSTLVDPVLPFSRPAQRAGSSRIIMIMISATVGAGILPIAAPLLYRTITGTVLLFLG